MQPGEAKDRSSSDGGCGDRKETVEKKCGITTPNLPCTLAYGKPAFSTELSKEATKEKMNQA